MKVLSDGIDLYLKKSPQNPGPLYLYYGVERLRGLKHVKLLQGFLEMGAKWMLHQYFIQVFDQLVLVLLCCTKKRLVEDLFGQDN